MAGDQNARGDQNNRGDQNDRGDQNGRGGIALCLSGGGFRATLFHLGLIKALRNHRRDGIRALDLVREIYSVSGGSILAAHLVRNWPQYSGGDAEFAAAEQAMFAFARRNVRDRVMRRWVLYGLFGYTRDFWLQREYRALLGPGTFEDCYRVNPRPPTLFVLATSFKTGELCCFSPSRFEIMRQAEDGSRSAMGAPGGHLKLAYAVAASSAFPPLFPPIALTHEMLQSPEGDEFRVPVYLADGGVFDNLGFEMYRLRHDAERSGPKVVVLSNAGGSFRSASGNEFSGVLSRNIRASDILMRRVAESTEAVAERTTLADCLHVRISRTVEDGSLPAATQQNIRLIRTDLDIFEPSLARLLVDHGYRVGAECLAAQGFTATPPDAAVQQPNDNADEVPVWAAGRSKAKFLAGLFCDFRDGTTIPFNILILSILALTLGSILLASSQHISSRNRLNAINKMRMNENKIPAKNFEEMFYDIEKDYFQVASERDDLQAENVELKRRVIGPILPETETDVTESAGAVDPLKSAASSTTGSANGETIARDAYKVWIQFAGVTRVEMIAFGIHIKALWPSAPGAARGGQRTPDAQGLNEVRFNPVDRKAAEALTTDVMAAGFAKMSPPKAVSIIPQGSLEIWVSR